MLLVSKLLIVGLANADCNDKSNQVSKILPAAMCWGKIV